MSKRQNPLQVFRALTLGVFGVAGCAGPSAYVPISQSAFTYPNSDVVPLGHVKGSASHTYFLQQPLYDDGVLKRQAIADALKGTDGDLIIDGDFTMTSQYFPLGATVHQMVEGTAVKISTVGARPKSAQLP